MKGTENMKGQEGGSVVEHLRGGRIKETLRREKLHLNRKTVFSVSTQRVCVGPLIGCVGGEEKEILSPTNTKKSRKKGNHVEKLA